MPLRKERSVLVIVLPVVLVVVLPVVLVVVLPVVLVVVLTVVLEKNTKKRKTSLRQQQIATML